MATEVVHSIRSSGGDYTSLSAWEAAQQRDLVTADEIAVAELYNDWAGDGLEDACIVSGWTTSATNYIEIRAADGEAHDGTLNSGARVWKTQNFQEPISLDESYCRLKRLQFKTENIYPPVYCLQAIQRIENCIMWNAGGDNCLKSNQRSAITAIGCLMLSEHATNGEAVIAHGNLPDDHVYANNTIIGSGNSGSIGIEIGTNADAWTISNNIFFDCENELTGTGNLSNETVAYNATDVASGSSALNGLDANAVYEITAAEFLDAANDDYRIDSSATSLFDAGADLGTASDYTDIEGFSFADSASNEHWPIGASRGVVEVVSAIRESGATSPAPDYTSFTAWEAAQQTTYGSDLTAFGEIAAAELYADDWGGSGSTFGLEDNLNAIGWTTSAACYMEFRAASGEAHDGTQGSGARVYNDNGLFQGPFETVAEYTKIKNLDIEYQYNSELMDLEPGCEVSGCILDCYANCIKSAGHHDDIKIISNIFFRNTAVTSGYAVSLGIYCDNVVIANNVFVGNGNAIHGLAVSAGSVNGVVKNNVFFEIDGIEVLLASGTDEDYNASSKTSANSDLVGANSIYEITSAEFLDAANDDYHLSTSSSLVDAGLNLYDSGDLTSPIYDIDGDAMPASGTAWPIGADYYYSAIEVSISIADSAHAHAADGLTLAQVHSLIVAAATHTHTADNATLTSLVELLINAATHAHTADAATLSQLHTLLVNEASHAHTADGLTLAQVHQLIIAAAAHAHLADAPTISQVHTLLVDAAAHGHSAENVTLLVTALLDIANAAHGHTAANVALSQLHTLLINDALHAHTVDQVVVITTGVLEIANSLHAHSAANIVLNQLHVLLVDAAAHGHLADNATLSQIHSLIVADSTHSHAADNATLAEIVALLINDALHNHTADNATLAQLHSLLIDAATHGHTADNAVLSPAGVLAIFSATHALSSDTATLSQIHSLLIDAATHGHIAAAALLSMEHLVDINSATHAHFADEMSMSLGYLLDIASAVHAHAADTGTFTQQHILLVSDALHAHFADNVNAYSEIDFVCTDQLVIIRAEDRTIVIAAEDRTLKPDSRGTCE